MYICVYRHIYTAPLLKLLPTTWKHILWTRLACLYVHTYVLTYGPFLFVVASGAAIEDDAARSQSALFPCKFFLKTCFVEARSHLEAGAPVQCWAKCPPGEGCPTFGPFKILKPQTGRVRKSWNICCKNCPPDTIRNSEASPENPEESGATLHIIQFLRTIRVHRRVRKNTKASPEESGRVRKSSEKLQHSL